MGQRSQALADFAASAAIVEEFRARPDLARILRGWGQTLRASARGAEGDEKLRRSLGLFQELGITTETNAVRATLAE